MCHIKISVNYFYWGKTSEKLVVNIILLLFKCFFLLYSNIPILQLYKVAVQKQNGGSWFVLRRYKEFHDLYQTVSLINLS